MVQQQPNGYAIVGKPFSLSLSLSLSLQKKDLTITWVSAGQRALNKTKSSCVVSDRDGNNSC
jgi:hypothetical protein